MTRLSQQFPFLIPEQGDQWKSRHSSYIYTVERVFPYYLRLRIPGHSYSINFPRSQFALFFIPLVLPSIQILHP